MLSDLISRSFELYKPLGGQWNEAKRRWRFPSGARMRFGYLESDKDKYEYQGHAYTFIGFDELTQMPGDEEDKETGERHNSAYLYMFSRLRPPNATVWGSRPMFIRATANPGGVGHSWVKQRFGIPDDGRPSERRDPRTGRRRIFIPAKLSDNPKLDKTYATTLQSLTGRYRKTLLEGRWDVYEGPAFSEFDSRIHVCDWFKIPHSWEKWRGGDDGYSAPACVLWFARDPVNDRIFVTNEIYGSGILASDLAAQIKERDPVGPDGNRVAISGILDESAFAEIEKGKEGRGTEMNKLGCEWRPCTKGQGSRLAGKAKIHELLSFHKRRDGRPGLVIFRNCTNLLRTLPALPLDDKNLEDVDTKAEDHAYDALRYGIQWRERGVKQVRVKEG